MSFNSVGLVSICVPKINYALYSIKNGKHAKPIYQIDKLN